MNIGDYNHAPLGYGTRDNTPGSKAAASVTSNLQSSALNTTHCRVVGCNEQHSKHTCRNCCNIDSNHFTRDCPTPIANGTGSNQSASRNISSQSNTGNIKYQRVEGSNQATSSLIASAVNTTHYRVEGSNQAASLMSSSQRKALNATHCQVVGCDEPHSKHTCRNCHNTDSNHFTRNCPMPSARNADLKSIPQSSNLTPTSVASNQNNGTQDNTAVERLTITFAKPKKYGFGLQASSNSVTIAGIDPSVANRDIQEKFKTNDQIVSIDGAIIHSINDAMENMKKGRLGKLMTFVIQRNATTESPTDMDVDEQIPQTFEQKLITRAALCDPDKPSTGVCPDYDWQWCGDDGNWNSYLPKDQCKIEQAFQANYDEVTFVSAQNLQTYHINTKNCTQTNMSSKKIKKIQRTHKGSYEWKWNCGNDDWIAYYPTHQKIIEEAFNTKSTVQVILGTQAYCIDTVNLTQRNLSGGNVRVIKRVLKDNVMAQTYTGLVAQLPLQPSQIPDQWTDFDDSSIFQCIPLLPNSKEYTRVFDRFAETCSASEFLIASISRVQNANLHNEYQLYRSVLAKEVGKECINEMELFHGTAHDVIEGICKDGFDWRVCGKNGTLYGHGSYFAKNASYSVSYARANPSGECKMFLVSVLVGKYSQGSGSLVKAPEGFHSVVDRPLSPSIYVVFLIKQAYPAYVISFKRIPACK